MTNINPLKNKKVIIIDDEKDVVDVFSDYLELQGANIVGVGYNGKDAVELYYDKRPEIAFLDVSMPDYDGFYALKKIKESDDNSVVVLITGDLTKETENNAKEFKASAIVYKPFKIDKLLDVLNRLEKNKLIIQTY